MYRVSFRAARATQEDPVLKIKNNNSKNPKRHAIKMQTISKFIAIVTEKSLLSYSEDGDLIKLSKMLRSSLP